MTFPEYTRIKKLIFFIYTLNIDYITQNNYMFLSNISIINSNILSVGNRVTRENENFIN